MAEPRLYVVEYEATPGEWRPVVPLAYEWCQDARLAVEALRKHQTGLRYRVTRWRRDGDGRTGGRRGG